ncbi:MAG: Rieske (2Fe-2S) protein [Dehalogenimonas sp.]|uniref:Rieske (2Fe-2S) protein n=1 Tax=Candidatus Dehalogenimonas loeffleri TaxID=3127115 RepID=A0ABZ2J5D8_9CHLR|nr:Rieske (2Fe-2S) protein [Dehalogenimonas sp.]
MGLIQAILGICETQPLNNEVWQVKEKKALIDLEKASALKGNSAVYLKGKGLAKPILVIHTGDEYRAYTNRCKHMGRKIDLVPGENKLRCCSLGHSEYDLDGKILKGPAKESINKYKVRTKDGLLIIDL